MAHDTEFWYQETEEKVHSAVFDHVRGLEQEQASLHRANQCHAQFYSNREEPGLVGTDGLGYSRRRWSGVTENVIQSVIDTAKSLIGKSKPKISIITEGANWDLQQLARQLDKFTFGMFQHLDIYELMPEIFRDACIFGTGCLRLISDGDKGELTAERVLIDNILVDEGEVPAGGMPRQLHHVRKVNRTVLIGMYPDFEEEIETSSTDHLELGSYRAVDSDMVLVVDSYYLSPGGDSPGRFVRAISDATLEDMEWTKKYYPYIFYRWSNPVTGWYGQGLAEGLLGFQIRINELNDFIKQAHDLIAVPRVFVEQSSRTLKPQLTDEIGHVVNYTGRPPTFFTPQALNRETYDRVSALKQSAFEFAGISEMAAHATRPEGIEAAVALRELSDNQSQRFSDQQARYEQAYVELAQLIIDMVRDMGKKPTTFVSTRFVEEIDWPEADFDKHKFTLRAMPSSILGETPAGKKQTIIEFGQYGIPLSPAEIRRLLDHPDLEQSDMLAKAKLEQIHWVIGKLSKDEWVQPDAFMDLTLGLELVNAAYLNSMMAGAPEETQELFRQWLEYADLELKRLAEPTPEEAALMAQQAAEQAPEGSVQDTALGGLTNIGPGTATGADAILPALAGQT
jgi:hypothetical protein